MIGAHLVLAHRFKEAEALLLPAEKKVVEARGEDAPPVADIRNRIVFLYTEWGKPEEAARWQAKIPAKTP